MIEIIIVTCVICWSGTIFFFFYFRKQKKKDKSLFSDQWSKFEKASEINNIEEIRKYGHLVIWNKSAKWSHKEIVLNKVASLVKENSELKKLWIDSHYLVLGIEPSKFPD